MVSGQWAMVHDQWVMTMVNGLIINVDPGLIGG